jgi:hypothetical protein
LALDKAVPIGHLFGPTFNRDPENQLMNETPPKPESPEPPSTAPGTPPSSLWARLLNIFATPGNVFDEVKASPRALGNWLAPALLSSVVGVIVAYVTFSQPAILQKLHEQQQAVFEAKVAKGEMNREQADQMEAAVEKFSSRPVLTIFGAVGGTVMSFVRIFGWALVLWLLAKWFLKCRIDYMKAAEVAGFASMIAILGMIISMLLTVNLGKMGASPSLALTVGDFDPKNKTHLLLGAVNIVNFWEIAILGLGLSRLANVPFARAAILVFGLWVVFALVAIGIGMGMMAL